MGTVIYAMLTSLDGYVADSDGRLSLPVPGPALHQVFNDQLKTTSASVYGRHMYEMMRYWGQPDDRDPVGAEFAVRWSRIPKLVVSRTLKGVDPGATLLRGDLGAEIARLKASCDGLIDVSGPTLAASVTALGLIDEYHLYVQPVVLGGGKPYFAAGARPALTLLDSEPLPDGVVRLRYAPAA